MDGGEIGVRFKITDYLRDSGVEMKKAGRSIPR